MPNDNAMTRLLFAILSQKCLKDIDWNKVARDPILQEEITNGHAARMRYSRFKKQMEGTTTVRRPRNSSTSPRKQRVEKRSKKPRSENAKIEDADGNDHENPASRSQPGNSTMIAGPSSNQNRMSELSQGAFNGNIYAAIKPEYHNRLTPALTPIHSPQLSQPLTPSFTTTSSTAPSTPQPMSTTSSFHSQAPAASPLFPTDMQLQSMDDMFAAFSMPNMTHDQSQGHSNSQPLPSIYSHHDQTQDLGLHSGAMLSHYSLQQNQNAFGLNDLVLPDNFWLQHGHDDILGSNTSSTPSAFANGSGTEQSSSSTAADFGNSAANVDSMGGGQSIGICAPVAEGNDGDGNNVKKEERW
ncbi:hypothetical protein F5884DRAFT_55171 [Xylogone sp. PMI_703]|nr:hypothetical protein F5884DRAFT_55171 [Xylogone sp. PMI_703]